MDGNRLDRTDLAHVKPTGAAFDELGRGEDEGKRNFSEISEQAASRSLEVLKQISSTGYLRKRLPSELVVLQGGIGATALANLARKLTLDAVDQQWADLAGGDASHAFEFEEWKLRGFSELERDVWMAAGLRAGQARWAADLRDGGLSPTDLGVDLHGWRVVDRLQRGEGAAAVARLLTAMRASEAG